MPSKARGLVRRRPDMLARLGAEERDLEPVRLPAIVEDASLFDVRVDDGPLLFDLTATKVLTNAAICGLVEAARGGEVLLSIPPGAVLDKLHRMLLLRWIAPYWSLRL
jgi:hypothetical protein